MAIINCIENIKIIFYNMQWNWTEFCSNNLQTCMSMNNNTTKNDLLMPCFQQIILHMPIYTIYAVISSYYFGSWNQLIIRNQLQLLLIYTRLIVTILLAIIPVTQLYYYYYNAISIFPIDVLLSCTAAIMWMVHAGFLLTLRKQGDLSHRGPLILNVFWISMFILDIIWLKTTYDCSYWAWSLTIVILKCIYGLTFIPKGAAVLIRPSIIDNQERDPLLGHRYVHFRSNFNELILGHAQDEANFISKLLFNWVEPLIKKGLTGNLKKIDDLFDLPDCLNITTISEKLQMTIYRTKTLVWALHKAFGREFYSIGILRFLADTAGFAGPLLLGGLLKDQSTTNNNNNGTAYIYALGLFLSSLISALCGTHFNWRIAIVGMKIRIGVVNAIYRKSLEANDLQDAKPEILNLMSTDTDRIVNSCISFHTFWSIPFQLFTTLYLLYTQIGAAFIAGLVFASALIPINRWLAVKIQKYSEGLMCAKDIRVTTTSETILGAKQVKIHAWEDIFIKKIKDCRLTEVEFLSKRKYLDAICVYFWATTPVLMCLLTFGVSVLLGNPLDAASTYTSVALLNMLIGPLNAFPWVLNGIVEAWVSVKRVQQLLHLPNMDLGFFYQPIIEEKTSETPAEPKRSVLQLREAIFSYNNLMDNDQMTANNFELNITDLNIKEGDLVCIDGSVGCGKTTLINGIIAAINCTAGSIHIPNVQIGFGYVSQIPWLQRGTIRENIIWGSQYDETRYRNVIYSCALLEDLQILGGDRIGIGENGKTLSGGQRMRISLARAVYQDKNIYLLDDVLASVDAHVANHIIKYCILGILKDKTRIIVTQNKTLQFHANEIVTADNGVLLHKTLPWYGSELSDDDDDDNDKFECNKKVIFESNNNLNDSQDDNNSLDSVMMEESKEYGGLRLNVIATYWKSMSGVLGCLVIFFVILMQITRNLSDAWLAYWVAETNFNHSTTNNSSIVFMDVQNNRTEHSKEFYLGIYATLAIFNSIVTLIRSFIFAYAGIIAAIFIHNKLLSRVIYTKFNFFDITSAGQILNRFSSDIYTIDDSLPFILNILLAQSVGLIGAVLITLWAMPWLTLIIIPMIPIYYNIQYRYRYASRDIKRISSNALSPLYSHFTETLQGLKTIRAMRANSRFQRDFQIKLEESLKAQLTSSAAQQWLGLRLQFLGSLLVGGAGLLAAITTANSTNPSLVGLAISYALSITSLLGGVLNAFAETEQEMIALERVSQYLELEEEENANGSLDPPFGWPSQGSVCFKGVYMKYREHLAPALVNLNIQTTAFERIAIVGRTGAGKSSVLAALLRVAPLFAGEITLDCVNLKMLPLKVLRDRIVIIPQEPFLFEGTVRSNLDPQNRYIDSEIWNAITNCLATPLVQTLGGLSGKLERGGNNISSGQRQLLCLTRALLKNSKVVCIDEGTSNLDSDSEAAIQIALRNSFKSSTIFVIVHRLQGLQHMDRIIVMDCGQIVEEGSPQELAENINSLFAKMLQEQHNTEFNLKTS